MEDQTRLDWDARYRAGSHDSHQVDPLAVMAYQDFVEPAFVRPGRALDLAGGVGRHALWLAERSWDVTLADISEIALEKAEWRAQQRGTQIHILQADLTQWRFESGGYDLVLVFFYLERLLFPEILRALNPGGFVIYKSYLREQLRFGGGPSHPMHLLEPNELLREFSSLRVLYYRETQVKKAVAELVARKPA